jgi:hypothetical protein
VHRIPKSQRDVSPRTLFSLSALRVRFCGSVMNYSCLGIAQAGIGISSANRTAGKQGAEGGRITCGRSCYAVRCLCVRYWRHAATAHKRPKNGHSNTVIRRSGWGCVMQINGRQAGALCQHSTHSPVLTYNSSSEASWLEFIELGILTLSTNVGISHETRTAPHIWVKLHQFDGWCMW